MTASGDIVIVALSGPMCAGKTTLAHGLASRSGVVTVATRCVLAARYAGRQTTTRSRLQELGDDLDARVGGAWVRDGVREALADDAASIAVVDALRTRAQLSAIGAEWRTFHIHLTAAADVLAYRYARKRAAQPGTELASFEAARANPTEAAVVELAPLADLVIDTGTVAIEDTRSRAIGFLNRRGVRDLPVA